MTKPLPETDQRVSEDSTSPTTATVQYRSLGVVGTLVDQRIQKWQRDLLGHRPTAQAASVATLARLRRGAGKRAGDVPDIFAFTLAPELAGFDAPEGPTRRETAAHIALTLYALHQQSRQQPMHQRGWGVGRALRTLHGPEEPSVPPDPITRRFQVLVTADSLDELTQHLRGVAQLLRGAQPKPIALDYGLLADDVEQWQSAEGAAGVRRRWARDYYRPRRQPKANGTAQRSDSTDESTDPEGN